jgi:hypothetical protein
VEQHRATAPDVTVESPECFSRNRKESILPSLSRTDEERLFLTVDIVDVDPPALSHPHPGSVEGFENGSVSHSESRVRRWLLEKPLDLLRCGNEAREPPSSREPDVLRRVVEDEASPVEESKESLDRRNKGALSARR